MFPAKSLIPRSEHEAEEQGTVNPDSSSSTHRAPTMSGLHRRTGPRWSSRRDFGSLPLFLVSHCFHERAGILRALRMLALTDAPRSFLADLADLFGSACQAAFLRVADRSCRLRRRDSPTCAAGRQAQGFRQADDVPAAVTAAEQVPAQFSSAPN